MVTERDEKIAAGLIARAADAGGETLFAAQVRAGAWDASNRNDIAQMAVKVANLLSDLNEVSAGLVEWAEEQMDAGVTPSGIFDKLKEAVRLSGLD